MRILLVEDETELAQRVAANLTRHGLTCEWLANADDALAFAADGFTVLVIDIGLPGMSGIELVRALRARSIATPILILTARSSWQEKVEGLNAGADDFIVKPVRTEELVARLHALARRAAGHSATRLSAGPLSIDTASGEAWLDDQPLALTAGEFRLLRLLIYNVGRTLSREMILDQLYSLNSERHGNAVEVLVGRLRRKVGPDRIATVRGLGYRLAA
ncbi:response regulator transcription factor [Sandaracinobacter neustonicus]|uniref:Response regulator transcription factor n=1 Tax=Sandaracinobacter neustonicus TaxID=1715348 RepID=A0A501XPN2_9SPHN|nr:response regulator transcription factor [Sandaracinobacter neustonicus]TPE62662.1 response regulator transcription factor [Sandaracinobacter neustonicus]